MCICYDSLPNCRRDGDLSVGTSVSIHVGAGIRKQAGWTQWSEIVTCKERFINLESCSRILSCTCMCT